MIAIIDYKAGNVRSVEAALQRLGVSSNITSNPTKIQQADKVIFPGVGKAGSAMQALNDLGLDQTIKSLQAPVLGICLGMQLLCKHTEEDDVYGLGLFDTQVQAFPPEEKVPHTGWNNFLTVKGALFRGIDASMHTYYVHGYAAALCKHTVATCQYIHPFSAALQNGNFYGTQFHPERSGSVGEQILQNFLNL